MGRAWDKFRLLLWKNWLLEKRRPLQLVIEIFVPVLLSALLVVIRTLVDVENFDDPVVYSPFSPYHFPGHNYSIPFNGDAVYPDNVTVSDPEMSVVCDLITGKKPKFLDQYNNKDALNILLQLTGYDVERQKISGDFRNINTTQWLVAYSPKVALTDNLMRTSAEKMPFIYCGVENATELERILTLPVGGKVKPVDVVLAGIAFPDALSSATDLPLQLNVSIRFPGERRVNDLDADSVESQSNPNQVRNWLTNLLFPLIQIPEPRNKNETDGGSPGYYNEGFLALQSLLSESLLKHYREAKNLNIPSPNISLQRFPYPPYLDDPMLIAMQSFVPLIILLSFVYTSISTVRVITTEKEKQLKEAMKMMGLPNWLHWTAWFVKTMILYFSSIIFITILLKTPIAGDGMYVLAKTDWSCVLAFLFCYIIASITYVFAISSLFSKANTAAIVTGLLFFLAYFPYVFLQNDYSNTSLSTKLGASLLSNTAMSYGFQIILMFEGTGAGLQWSNMWSPVTPGDSLTMGHIMGFLLIDAAIYMIFTIYVEGVFPGEYGVPLPWNFPFTRAYWLGEVIATDETEPEIAPSKDRTAMEPEPRNKYAGVKIRGLRKVYGNGKVAVDGLNLNMYEGQITVLLGHNGAGKTTTMSMLTGLYTPTSGTAIISGHDIRSDMDGVRETLGLCPQHNVLFDDLSVKEHLDFFGKLKGLTGKNLNDETTRFIKLLELENKTNSPSKSLSGGMKRKLAAAVALCGGSKVVLFDEPTSGMDPSARRALWDLLTLEKAGRTILLTTHFMDEADLLGDRIAIMSEGRLHCVGSSFFLKKRYGGGYHLIMVKEPTCQPAIVTSILRRYMPGIEPSADIGSELSYHLDDAYQPKFEEIFTELENRKEEVGIQSYGVSLTTMEEVFIKVGSDSEVRKDDGEDDGVSRIEMNGNSKSMHTSVTVGSSPLLTGWNLEMNQISAMFFKYMMSTIRSWLLYVIIIIIPVLDLTISILVGRNFQGTNDLPERAFTFQDYTEGVAVVADLDGEYNSLVDNYKALVAEESGTVRDLNSLKNDLDVSQYILKESEADVGKVSQTYLLGTTFEKSGITAMFNNQPYHIPPMALSYLYNAILRTFVDSQARLNFVNHPLPYTAETKVQLTTQGGNMGFQIAFNMGFSFSFIVAFFIVFFVRERVSKSKHLQFVSGVNVVTYWVTAYLWNILISLGPILGVIFTLAAFQEDGFKTFVQLGTCMLLLICAIIASLPISYLASFLFDVPAAGFSRLIMINVFTGVAAFIVVMVLQTPALDLLDTANTLDWIFTFLPTYSLTASFSNLNKGYLLRGVCRPISQFCTVIPNICCKEPSQCPNGNCVAWSENDFDWDPPGVGRNVVIFFVMAAILFSILMIFELGFLDKVRYRGKGKVAEAGPPPDDADVKAENDRIRQLAPDQRRNLNLLLQGVSKYYGGFRAVNNLNLGVRDGECFGLLGVNGAGKTTTFKMMTGDESISAGDAFVQGLSLKYDMKKVHQLIGYCPQFDALLDDLTGRETLRVFCLLRGVASDEITALSEKLARELLFYKHIDKKVKEYSGGNKRKLSTALALIGEPPVVYLDEPTTGMDPVAKRHLWDVICKVRDSGKTIILTSHSMEECEALCTRLAIMVNGEFKCLGSTQHLKDKFAEGYTLSVKVRRANRSPTSQVTSDVTRRRSSALSDLSSRTLQRLDSDPGDVETGHVKRFIETKFSGATLKEEYQGLLTYRIPRQQLTWSRMFGIMQGAKERLNIEDYSLGQTSLEQVFLSFTKYQNNRNAPE